MRTANKILVALLLAIWPLAAKSQVFSQNIVGYVNIPLPKGLALLCDPFSIDGTNNINTVMTNTTAPNGTQVFLWNVTNQAFSLPATLNTNSKAWLNPDLVTVATNYLLPPGRGFVISSPANWRLTIGGVVPQGTLTNFIAGTNRFSLLGNIPPVTGQLDSNTMHTIFFPEIDGADVFTFNTNSQVYSDAYTYFQNYGWFDPAHLVDTNGPSIPLLLGFFVQNPGPDTNWIQTFIVPNNGGIHSLKLAVAQPVPQISYSTFSANQASLQILDPGGTPYDVQFSLDCLTWQTVASNLTSASWTGALPDPNGGYFRVINH
jgi:hypothetical protein